MAVTRRVNLGMVFFPVAIASTLVVLYVVATELSTVVAVKGVYALLGLLIAAAIYYRYPTGAKTAHRTDPRRTWPAKLLVVLAALSIATTALTDDKLLGLLVVLPAGYGLFAWQILDGAPQTRLLGQILGLFAIPPLLEYLTAGFYFGNGDLFRHVLYVDRILSVGELSAIPSSYQYFPGLHLLVGSVSSVTGLPPYDALLLAGLLVSAEAMLVVYLLARVMFHTRLLSLLITVAATTISLVSFFASYFFPQSFAVILLLNVLLVAVYANVLPDRRTLSAVAFVFGATVLFTHHLSIVLFAPILGLLAVGGWIFTRTGLADSNDPNGGVLEPRYMPLVVIGIAGIVYWTALRVFIPGLITQTFLVQDQYSTPERSTSIYHYDVATDPETVRTALAALGSPSGVYNIVLIVVLTLGLAWYLDRCRRYMPAAGVLLVGLAGAVLILPSPLSGKGLARVSHPLSFFFSFVVGGGLAALVTGSRRSRAPKVIFVVVVLVLGTIGPVLAGGDVYDLQEDRQSQKELSDGEVAKLRAISSFDSAYGVEVTTDWVTGAAMMRFQGTRTPQVGVAQSGLQPGEGLFIYRERWSNHVVIISSNLEQSRFVPSETWLNRAVHRNSKVYTAGQVGATWSPREQVWSATSPNRTST